MVYTVSRDGPDKSSGTAELVGVHVGNFGLWSRQRLSGKTGIMKRRDGDSNPGYGFDTV
jgi:hypothetical protein